MKTGTTFHFLVLGLILFLSPVTALLSQKAYEPFWRASQAPNVQDVRVMAADSGNNIYAAVWGDGIYKSSSKGLNWTKISTGLTNTCVNCLEIDKNGNMYAGTMGGGLFVSTNSGSDWTAINNGLTNLNVKAVGLAYGTTLYAGTYGSGVFRTDDGGATWLQTSEGITFRDINCIAVFADSNVVAGTNGGGMYKSSNRGSSWIQVGKSMKSPVISDMAKTKFGDVLALTYGNGVYYSYLGGSEWLPYYHSMENMPLNGKTLALYEGEYPTVAQYSNGLIYFDMMYLGIPDSSAWRQTKIQETGVNDVLITKDNDIFIAEPFGGIHISTDRGKNFDERRGFYMFPDDPGQYPLFAYNDILLSSSANKGIYKSPDKGLTWSLKALDNVEVYAYYADNSGILYAATESGAFKSTDLGDTWTNINWTTPVYSVGSYGSDLFICDSAVRRSTNGGNSWSVCGEPHRENTRIKIFVIDEFGNIFASLNDAFSEALFRSTNQGLTFTKIIPMETDNVFSVALHSNKVYAGTLGGLMISTDKGNTWNTQKVNGINYSGIDRILFNKSGDMFLSSIKCKYLLHSTDEGLTCDTLAAGSVRGSIKDVTFNNDGDMFFSTSMIYRAIDSSDLEVPALSSPPDGAGNTEARPLFLWNEVQNTDLYELQLSPGNDFVQNVETAVTVDTRWKTFTKLEYGTKYFWRVRSKRNKSHSAWSEARYFTTATAPPVLLSPADSSCSIDTAVTLTWNSVKSASSYQVQASTDEGFSNIVLDKDKLANTSQTTASKLTVNTPYYWRVRAFTGTQSSAWSDTWVFTTKLAPPLLIKPTDKAITQSKDLSLTWDTVPGAKSYNVVLAGDQDFKTILYDSLSTTKTSFASGQYEVGKTYYWKVRALDGGNEGYWSVARRFTVSLSSLTLIYPQNNSKSIPNDVPFEWNGPANAESYHLQVATDSSFNSVITEDNAITGTTKLVPGLSYGVYYWRVRFNLGGSYSEWTDAWKFTTDPGLTLLLTPAADSENIALPPELTWDAPKIAESFIIEVATDPDFKNIKFSRSKLTEKKISVPSLLNYTKYYWHLRFTVGKDTSAWSETRAFTTVLSRTFLVAPDNEMKNCETTRLFSWKSVNGATLYHLQVARDNEFGDIFNDYNNIADTFKLVSDLDTGTTFYWRVKALYSGGEGAWSVVWKFITASKKTGVDDDDFYEVVKPHAWPNPFGEEATLEYTLEKDSYVEIYLTDLTGARVATLQEGAVLPPGRRQLSWDASHLPGGTYYYCISINNKEHIYKILKIE